MYPTQKKIESIIIIDLGYSKCIRLMYTDGSYSIIPYVAENPDGSYSTIPTKKSRSYYVPKS